MRVSVVLFFCFFCSFSINEPGAFNYSGSGYFPKTPSSLIFNIDLYAFIKG